MIGWLKKFLKSDNFLSLLNSGLQAGLGFVGFIILLRTYTQKEVGIWVLYMTLLTFIQMVKWGLLKIALVSKLAASSQERKKQELIGSAWAIGWGMTLVVSLGVWLLGLLLPALDENESYRFFFRWFPLFFMAVLPQDFGLWITEAESRFDRALWLKASQSVLFFIFLIINYLQLSTPIENLVLAHIFSISIASLLALVTGWARWQDIWAASRQTAQTLFDFGKYTLGTYMSSNLLKSADTFLIDYFLNPAMVAFYNVPLKLVQLLEIPLRALVSAALPKLSKASGAKNLDQIQRIFWQYILALTALFSVLCVFCALFAEWLVVLLSDESYLGAALILQIFMVYCFFLPLDRFLGVTLDALGKPKYNTLKVSVMAAVNVLGDVLVLSIWGEIWLVAVVTLLNLSVGILYGVYILNRFLPLRWAVLKSVLKSFQPKS